MTPVLLVDEPAPHVRRLTLNRPEQLNTMTAELCEGLHVELRATAALRSCRAVIVTGAGRGFCAGLDLHGYEDRQQIVATMCAAPEAVAAFLEKRPAEFID